MGLVGTETIERIKRENDIVSVATRLGLFDGVSSRQTGRKTIQIKCIFHEEKSASLTLYVDTGTYYCFGCSEFGDVIKLVSKKLNLNFPQTLKWFDPSLEIGTQINYDEAKKYLVDHGISYESQVKFDFCFSRYWIGPTPYPSIKFKTPGGYKHRLFGFPKDKYRFEKGGHNSLFKTGGDPKIAVITEGEFDAIRTNQETGYSCFSSTVGNTAFKKKYLSEMGDFDLYVVGYDNDAPGKDGARKAIKTLIGGGIDKNKIVQIEVQFPSPKNKDWCDFFGSGFTKEDFDELINLAVLAKRGAG